MSCRCCRNSGQSPYEIADVMAFVEGPPPDSQRPQADGSADVTDDEPVLVTTAPAGAYRFAWSG